MTTMTIHVPEALEKDYNETVRLIAAKLYEAGKLNLRQAAEICGLKKWEFPEVLSEFNVPVFQYSSEDIIEDVERVSK